MQLELPAIRTAWVKASMQPLYKKEIVKKQIGTRTITKTKGIFSKTQVEIEEPIYEDQEKLIPTGRYSDTEIDIEEFSNNINRVCHELTALGYKILQVIPMNSGRYKYEYKETSKKLRLGDTEDLSGGYGYGYGYGITDGVIIIGELKV